MYSSMVITSSFCHAFFPRVLLTMNYLIIHYLTYAFYLRSVIDAVSWNTSTETPHTTTYVQSIDVCKQKSQHSITRSVPNVIQQFDRTSARLVKFWLAAFCRFIKNGIVAVIGLHIFS